MTSKNNKNSPVSKVAESSIADKYFSFLGTTYVTLEGTTRQPAATKFINVLKKVHADGQSGSQRFDVSACLAGKDPAFKGRVWFWSDLHLFHTNILTYCQRAFDSIGNMNETLLANCLATVTKDDILIFGGDISFGNLTATNEWLRAIPAYKINVVGNHDVNRKVLLNLAVDEQAACLELDYCGQKVLVTHYPVKEDFLETDWVNLHGHIHNTPFPPGLGSGQRHINMSVEHLDYAPVSLDTLLSKPRELAKRVPARPASPWQIGRVVNLNKEAGFGYVQTDAGDSQYIFVVGHAIRRSEIKRLTVGEKVAFELLDHGHVRQLKPWRNVGLNA